MPGQDPYLFLADKSQSSLINPQFPRVRNDLTYFSKDDIDRNRTKNKTWQGSSDLTPDGTQVVTSLRAPCFVRDRECDTRPGLAQKLRD